MPGFLDIPAPVRHSIIAMSFWYPDNHFVELAVSREWYEQILPLLYDIYYDRWARTIDVHGELTQMLYSSSAVWPWSEEETDEWSEPDSPFPEEMEYDERDEDYCDCIKIDGIRYHCSVFSPCGRLKRLGSCGASFDY